MGLTIFDLVTLKFDLLSKTVNLGHSFLTRGGRAFIFHMCIPCGKTLAITFEPEDVDHSYFSCALLVIRPCTPHF